MSKTKNVDVLDEDKPIAGQKYVCVSFISPETLIKQRAMYDFEQFVSKWDIQKSLERFNGFLGFKVTVVSEPSPNESNKIILLIEIELLFFIDKLKLLKID